MARPRRGKEVLEQAKGCLRAARTAEELREAQAVVLPLEYGLTLKQTAEAIGKSVRRTTQLRGEFIRRGGPRLADQVGRGGRRRQNMTPEEEEAFLALFAEEAKTGGVLVVSRIKQAWEARLGRKVALASVYNLLHRHGWRKLAPDKRNPKTDVAAQTEWKKNFRKPSPRSPGRGWGQGRSD
jgi:transposase